MCFTVELPGNCKLPVAMRPGETPVPIPNTTVKTQAADGTALETVWESRRLPEPQKKKAGGKAEEIERAPTEARQPTSAGKCCESWFSQ